MKTRTNRNKFRHRMIVCSIITLGSFLSISANPLAEKWYVGGSLGLSDIKPDGGDTWNTSDGKDTSKKIYVGTDISPQVGLEAFWADFGNAEMKSKNGDTGKVHYQALGANIIYNSPYKVAGLRPLGKLGVAKFNNKDKGAVSSKQNNKIALFGGIGAEFDLTKNLKVRSEYEYFDKDISNLSVGLNWSPEFRDHSFISEQNKIKPPVANKKPDNIINVFVPQQPVAKTQPIVIRQARPRVIQKQPPAPEYKILHKTLAGGSHFDSGRSQLTWDGRLALDKLVQELQNQTLKSIRIVGHTDSIGSSQTNLSLSYARANSVASYLASRGINRQLMNTQGLGESSPIADNRTAHGRALNRRVEITARGATRIRIK